VTDHQKTDVVDLVVAYARQETIGPLRGAGRWVLWGLVSMAFISVGMVLLVLGALRLIQDVSGTALSGNFSWVPYTATVLLAAITVAVAVGQIRKTDL
jgi:hypothetical protein